MIFNYTGVTFQQKSILDDPREHYPAMGLRVYEYQWEHLSSGKSGTSEVACHNEHRLVSLLNAWNVSKDWKYTRSLNEPHEW